MRIACKVDANQAEIVKALREAGATVTDLSKCGRGVPDLLVGYKNINTLLELKMPGGKLTPPQVKWHKEWLGDVHVVYSAEEAVRTIKEVAHAYGK